MPENEKEERGGKRGRSKTGVPFIDQSFRILRRSHKKSEGDDGKEVPRRFSSDIRDETPVKFSLPRLMSGELKEKRWC